MTCIITGASRGIGFGLAERFAQAGFDLVLCSRNEEKLTTAKRTLAAAYPDISIHIRPTDLSDKTEAQAFGAFVLEHCATIDVLINNAGVFVPGSISSEPDGALELQLSTNLYSAYHLTRSLLPKMQEAGKGHIFNIGSVASLQAYPASGAYTISKHALLGFSRSLRHEVRDKGIKVTDVFPGAVYTDSWKGSGIPEERMIALEDIAQAVYACHELSDRALVEDLVIRPQLGDL